MKTNEKLAYLFNLLTPVFLAGAAFYSITGDESSGDAQKHYMLVGSISSLVSLGFGFLFQSRFAIENIEESVVEQKGEIEEIESSEKETKGQIKELEEHIKIVTIEARQRHVMIELALEGDRKLSYYLFGGRIVICLLLIAQFIVPGNIDQEDTHSNSTKIGIFETISTYVNMILSGVSCAIEYDRFKKLSEILKNNHKITGMLDGIILGLKRSLMVEAKPRETSTGVVVVPMETEQKRTGLHTSTSYIVPQSDTKQNQPTTTFCLRSFTEQFAVYDVLHDGITAVREEDQKIVYMNFAMGKLLNTNPNLYLGQHAKVLVPANRQEAYVQYFKDWKQKLLRGDINRPDCTGATENVDLTTGKGTTIALDRKTSLTIKDKKCCFIFQFTSHSQEVKKEKDQKKTDGELVEIYSTTNRIITDSKERELRGLGSHSLFASASTQYSTAAYSVASSSASTVVVGISP